jgi:hypothetical protein
VHRVLATVGIAGITAKDAADVIMRLSDTTSCAKDYPKAR